MTTQKPDPRHCAGCFDRNCAGVTQLPDPTPSDKQRLAAFRHVPGVVNMINDSTPCPRRHDGKHGWIIGGKAPRCYACGEEMTLDNMWAPVTVTPDPTPWQPRDAEDWWMSLTEQEQEWAREAVEAEYA